MPNEVATRVPHQLSALRHRDFRIFWTGAFLSFIGNWVQNVAQGWYVFHLTNDPAMLGLVSFAGQIPIFFLGPFAGIVADVWDKRKVVLTTQALLASTALILALLIGLGLFQIWQIILLSLFNGVVWAVDVPARQALVSELVDEEDIPNAVPLTGATFNTARLVGPLVASLLLANFAVQTCFLFNGLSYSTMLAALFTVRNRRMKVETGGQDFMRRITDGMRTVIATPAFRTLILIEISASVFGLFYLAQIPAYATVVLNAGTNLGYLYTATAIGAVSGLGVLALLSRRGRGRVPAFGLVGFSVGLVGLGLLGMFSPGPVPAVKAIACLCMVLTGFFGTTILNGCNTLLQSNAPEQLRGRVVAVHFWAVGGFGPVGNILFGWIARQAGVAQSFVIGGAICCFIGLLAVSFAQSVRSLR